MRLHRHHGLVQFFAWTICLLSLSIGNGVAAEMQSETSHQDPDLSDYRQFVSYPHLEKGLRAYANNDYGTAIHELYQAHQLAPNSRRIALQYALALEANGQSNEAMSIIQPWITQGTATREMQSAYRQMWLNQSKHNLRQLRAAASEQTFQKILNKIDVRFESAYDESVYVDILAKSPYVTDAQLIAYSPRDPRNLQALLIGRLEQKSTPQAVADFLNQIAPLLIAHPDILDQTTYLLSMKQQARPAASILMQAYPFSDYPSSTRANLLGRLSNLTIRYPELFTTEQTQQLCRPLSTQSERSLQIEILKNLNACACLRDNFIPYTTNLNARDWANVSQCYTQQPGLAEYAAEKSIAADPKAEELKVLAYSAYKAEDYPTAVAAWRKVPAYNLTPTDLLAAQTTAIAAGDWDLARKQMLAYQAINAAPNDRFYWNQAQISVQEKEWQIAAIQLKEAIKLRPDASYYDKLGFVEQQLGHSDLSLTAYEKAAELAPDDSQIQSSLGFTAYSHEDYPRAIHAFNEALKGRPDDIALTEQLAYSYQKLGTNDSAIHYSKLAIDDYQRRSPAEISDRDINTEFGLRRMNEDLARRFTFNLDGAISNNATPLTGSPQPGLSYRNFWQAEAAYRLGDMGVDNGRTFSAYSRIFSGNGFDSTPLPINSPMLGMGFRWKPFTDQVINLAAEEQIPLDHVQQTRSDTLVRASGSFFNSGRYSDEWHPTGSGWFAQNLYLDAAYYLGASTSTLTADYRSSYHYKLPNAKTIEPYAHLQWNTMNTVVGDDFRIGVGLRWNMWRNEDKYNAYSSRYFIGIEAQHAFTTYLNSKNAVLAVLGIRL